MTVLHAYTRVKEANFLLHGLGKNTLHITYTHTHTHTFLKQSFSDQLFSLS